MASIFMKISGCSPEGGATIEQIKGKGDGDGGGYFAIDTLNWGAVRGIDIDVGNAKNTDHGMVALGEVNVTRSLDAASAYLTSILYSPGEKGKFIEIIMTQPNKSGNGAEPYLVIALTVSCISSYNMGAYDGQQAKESFSLTYSSIESAYYTLNEKGHFEKTAVVGFDVRTGKTTSLADIGGDNKSSPPRRARL